VRVAKNATTLCLICIPPPFLLTLSRPYFLSVSLTHTSTVQHLLSSFITRRLIFFVFPLYMTFSSSVLLYNVNAFYNTLSSVFPTNLPFTMYDIYINLLLRGRI